MEIAFIGLGAMGAPIAANLLASGHSFLGGDGGPAMKRGMPLPVASLARDRLLAARSMGAGSGHDLAALAFVALAEAGLQDR